MLLRLDRATVLLARVTFAEGKRLKRIPHGVSFEKWMVDAVWERAHEAFTPRWPDEPGPTFAQKPSLRSDGVGSGRRLRYLREG